MTSTRGRSFARYATALGLLPAALAAQEAVTVSGHVSANNHPIQGATVRIQELNLGGSTDADGRYSFIVPSSRVRGQTVTLTARYVRYSPESVQITLVGGSLSQDFTLVPPGERRSQAVSQPQGSSPTRAAASTSGSAAPVVVAVARPTVDSTAFDEIAGPVDLVGALAGRVVGLHVTSATTLGGSEPVALRGYRSILGTTQPLFVVDGIPLDNSNVVMPGQPFGLGGFDYGSAIHDLNPADVASVRVLRGPEAAALYGGRAANGVVEVTTKNGRGLIGFEVSANQQITFESTIRLPKLQNAYGQGLGGKFAFFDGAGGGTNDAVAENWGPALSGQPIAQASLTEPRRPDVRPWLAHPDNMSAFFASGRTLKTNAAAQGSNEHMNFRLSGNLSDSRGLTPDNDLSHQSAIFTGGDQLTDKLFATLQAQFAGEQVHGRPATGFDTSNPVADFMRMGRQVDLSQLEAHTKDAAGSQLSWNYSGFNNPYFAALENTNKDDRTHWIGGGSATYAFSNTLRATVRGGTDHSKATRDFEIDSTWMGGFPYYAGRGDFSKGGFQHQSVAASETNGDAFVTGSPAVSGGQLTITGGAGHRTNSFDLATTASDLGARSATGPSTSAHVTADANTNSLYGTAVLAIADYASISASARNEWYSVLASGNNSALYPALFGSIDLARAGGVRNGPLSAAVVHAGWGRSGGEISPLLLRSIFTGTQTTQPKVEASPNLGPEATNSFELGTQLGFFNSRLGVDLTYYSERTSDVVVGLTGTAGSIVAANAATISNSGFEAQLTMIPLRVGANLDWTIEARYAKNTNNVEEIAGGASSVALGPSVNGLTVEATKGAALGALVGNAFQRDPATGALLLQAGHPIPETKPRVLGVMAPDWIGGANSTFHVGAVEVTALVDARIGGKVFSTSNMAGATSGTLAETSFRPDTGLLLSGIDVATGKANTQHVSTEAYYHSLAAIQERWVYDASVVKLRDIRFTVALPLRMLPVLSAQSFRMALIGRNLAMWTKAANIDPETALSVSSFQGIEMGQLPTARSVGFQLSITP
jgi:TonB-dependent SusC/RagA subfamily outer membrane receptor